MFARVLYLHNTHKEKGLLVKRFFSDYKEGILLLIPPPLLTDCKLENEVLQ